MTASTIPDQDDIERTMMVMEAAFPAEFGEAWTRRQLIDALVVGNAHLALVDATGLAPAPGVAGAGFSLSRTAYDEEELLLIAVDPHYRDRGLGLHLLRSVCDAARKRGAQRLLLEMRRGNPAETLYRRFGFTPIGERRDYYRLHDGRRIDAVTFVLPLLY